MEHPHANEVTVFIGFQSDAEKSEKIDMDRLSDFYPELFKKGSEVFKQFPGSSLPIEGLLTGEFVLPCSVHAYILQTYKSKTLDEIVEELELLLDKISDICGNETDFVKLLSFCLALLDCFGDVLFGCETSELRKKLELLHERVRSLTSAQHLFAKNISLIKNKAAFVPSIIDHTDYYVKEIRMREL